MRYSRDPLWITARYAGTCRKCGETFGKGATIFFYPNGKVTLSGQCAKDESASFEAAAADENFMGGYER